MALTLAQLQGFATHALGGAPSSEFSTTQIVNEGGRLLVSLSPWNWLIRRSATLDFAASTNYVSLPSDFLSIVGIEMTSGLTKRVKMTTANDIVSLRTGQLTTTVGLYYAAITHPTQTAVTSAPPAPVLELWPTPSAAESAAMTLFYRAKWTELASATDVANVPAFIESLLIACVRAVAQGYEDGESQERINEIRTGSLLELAREQDGGEQHTLGPPERGHTSEESLFLIGTELAAPS